MITSPHNQKLKEIRKLTAGRGRSDRFVAEGEDLVEAGWEPEYVLRAGTDVEPALLDAVSTLGSGTRVIGVYRERWSEPGGSLSVWLDRVRDPGNVGTIIRSAHALCDGPVVLGPGCADPFGVRAVRASMGSVFARPPARARVEALPGTRVALHRDAPVALADVEVEPPVVVLVGAEREGLSQAAVNAAEVTARIPLGPDAPDSLNAAMAATVALYELGRRISAHG